MTTREKYSELLESIGEMLQKKNTDIYFYKIKIEQLEEKLKAAEEQAKAGVVRTAMIRELNAAIWECINIDTRQITDIDRLLALQKTIADAILTGGAA